MNYLNSLNEACNYQFTRITTFCLLLCLTAFNSQSQDGFAIRSGLNYSIIKNLIFNPEYKAGLTIGVASKFKVSRRSSLEVDLVYSSKGLRTDNSNTTSLDKFNFKYLSIPIVYHIKAYRNANILLGIESSYLIGVNFRFNKQLINISRYYPNKFDLGPIVGIGYSITPRTHLDFRYVYGLNTLKRYVDGGGVTHTINAANRVFQIGLNLNICNKKKYT